MSNSFRKKAIQKENIDHPLMLESLLKKDKHKQSFLQQAKEHQSHKANAVPLSPLLQVLKERNSLQYNNAKHFNKQPRSSAFSRPRPPHLLSPLPISLAKPSSAKNGNYIISARPILRFSVKANI